jgi:serine/threonine protein kinase
MTINIKTGYFSIVLEKSFFKKYINKPKTKGIILDKKMQTNKILLKITTKTQMTNYNGEIELGQLLQTIDKSSKYFAKYYTDKIYNIDSNNLLMLDIKNRIECEHILFKTPNLIYYYIENVGRTELYDILNCIKLGDDEVFTDFGRINLFSNQMLNALKYLHSNDICHFDIKPENIIYNDNPYIDFNKRFKLIDFGHSEKYPFNNYLNCGTICGTEYYCPIPLKLRREIDEVSKSLPVKNCNDWVYYKKLNKNRIMHYCKYYDTDNRLLFKTDIYSLGIVFYQLYYYKKNYDIIIDLNTVNFRIFIDTYLNLIQNMTHSNIETRYNISDCLRHPFVKHINSRRIKCTKRWFCC